MIELVFVHAIILNIWLPFGPAVCACRSSAVAYPLTRLSRPHWCRIRSGERVSVIYSFEIPGFNNRESWSPLDVLYHCLAHTQCKLIVVDSERADRLEPVVQKLAADAGTTGFLVLEAHEGKGKWNGMQTWEEALKAYKGDPQNILNTDPGIIHEDNATILFTSGALSRWYVSCPNSHAPIGTTGLPKGVLSTQRQWLTNVLNVRSLLFI